VRIADKPTGVISFVESALQAEEQQGTATLTLLRTDGSEGTATVRVSVIGGTAEEGTDFVLKDAGIVSFAPGETSKTLTIGLVDDALVEPAESIVLRLNSLSPGVLLSGVLQCTVTLGDNDVPGERVGAYTGVFQIPGLRADQLARLSLTVSAGGVVTGRLSFGPGSIALRGVMDAQGVLTLSLLRPGDVTPLTFRLSLAGTHAAPELVGTVEGDGGTGELSLGQRAVFARAARPLAVGRYAIALTPPTDPALPKGWGWLAIEVKGSGVIAARGRLGDGSPVSASTWLSKADRAAFWVSRRAGREQFSAALSFTTAPGPDVAGEFTWMRGVDSHLESPRPFSHSAVIRGSAVFGPVLPPNGELWSFAGASDEPVVLPFTQPTARRFVVGARGASLKITPATGQFSGQLAVPPLGKTARFQGIWLQDEARGYGSLLQPNGGPVELRAGE
jgi:hypothetical protein